MKTLLLLRHAKSSWDDPGLHDFDRPLAARGERDAPRMGRALRKRGLAPELALSSPAARTRQTIEALARAARLDLEPKFDKNLYAASAAELMRTVRRLPPAASCVLLVGHNPGLEDLLGRLTGARDAMPTAALACIDLMVARWDEVEDSSGDLRWLLKPKELDKD